MLAHILGLAKGGRGDEALGMFDEAYKPLLGVGSRVVVTLDDGQLIDLLTSGSNPDMRRVALALQLLTAEADLYRQAGRPGRRRSATGGRSPWPGAWRPGRSGCSTATWPPGCWSGPGSWS